MTAPPKIEICGKCGAHPIISEHERVFYCTHRGDLICEAIGTGAVWGIASVTPDELQTFLKSRSLFYAATKT